MPIRLFIVGTISLILAALVIAYDSATYLDQPPISRGIIFVTYSLLLAFAFSSILAAISSLDQDNKHRELERKLRKIKKAQKKFKKELKRAHTTVTQFGATRMQSTTANAPDAPDHTEPKADGI